MVDRVKAGYVGLTQWITGFQQEIAELADAGKLDRTAEVGLLEHYRDLQEAVDAATADALSWHPVAGVRDFTDSRGRFPDFVHRLADHAKYVYAVGTRDIAALQYRLAELAGTGRLDHAVNKHLQWHHCLPINQTIGAVQSGIGDGRTIVRSAGGDNGSNPATASTARKTPVRDAVNKASSDITKVVTKVSDSMKQALAAAQTTTTMGTG